MLASIILYVWIAERSASAPKESDPVLFYAIAGLALSVIVVAVVIRLVFIPKQANALATKPDDVATFRRWQALHIVLYALCEAIALYGLVLRFVGFGFSSVALFYLAGFLLMLVFPQKRPVPVVGLPTP